MDVRCESCQTVYEFDDARVKETGVTVKCTQCGHIFKVRKRGGPRGPSTLPGFAPIRDGSGPHANPPQPAAEPPSTTSVVSASGVQGAAAATPPQHSTESSTDRMWMLRTAGSGEVHRFRDLTTLQQWIVEMKAGRDDEISRNGDRWKRIGGIAELEPFFRVVEAARVRAANPQRTTRPGDDPALHSTAPQMPMAPAYSGPQYVPAPEGDEGAVATWRVQDGDPGASQSAGSDNGASGGEVDEVPRRGPSGTVVLAVATVLVLLGVVSYLAVYKHGALRSMVTADEGARGHEAWRKGREYFLLDTDDDFQHADQQFQRAQGADESKPEPVAALVELNTTWARHLREDAHLAESSSPARADELRRQAQTRLDEARRYANEARSLGPADPSVNRALADLLVLDGAPAAQVEEALRRAESRRTDDPEVIYVRGALKLREGQLDEARALLEQADKLNQAQTQHDLLRASYLVAVLHAQAGRVAEAKAATRRILEANPHHVRAAALAAWVESGHAVVAPTAPAPGVAAIAPAAPTPTAPAVPAPGIPSPTVAPPVVAPAPAPVAGALPAGKLPTLPAGAAAEPHGYASLVANGNKLLERGKGKEAVKLFEKALAEQPGGLEAMTGMAWALLDTEHYGAAADKFREVLAVVPNNGEAIIGTAETYKLRGDRKHALEWYKKYLVELPRGSKAQMAEANVRDLEDEITHKERPTAGEVHDAPPLPPPPPSP